MLTQRVSRRREGQDGEWNLDDHVPKDISRPAGQAYRHSVDIF